jgi:hypothetical protein
MKVNHDGNGNIYYTDIIKEEENAKASEALLNAELAKGPKKKDAIPQPDEAEPAPLPPAPKLQDSSSNDEEEEEANSSSSSSSSSTSENNEEEEEEANSKTFQEAPPSTAKTTTPTPPQLPQSDPYPPPPPETSGEGSSHDNGDGVRFYSVGNFLAKY